MVIEMACICDLWASPAMNILKAIHSKGLPRFVCPESMHHFT